MSDEKSPDGSYGWVIVAVSMLALIISNGLSIGGIPVFFKPIQTEFIANGAVPADQAQSFIANGATLTFLMSGVFSMTAGWLIPRLGLKNLMIIGCVCLGAGLVIHSQAASVWTVYFSRFLMGVSLGFVGVTPNVVLVAKWFRKNRGTALGIMLTGTSIGGVLIPIVAAPLILSHGWRDALLALSMIVWVILLPAVVLLVRDKPGIAETQSDQTGMTLRDAVRTPLFWIFGLCAALVFYPIFATTQQFILYLQSPRIGMSLEVASWCQSILFAVSVLGKSVVGFLSDRFTATRVMLVCAVVMFLSTFVLLALTASNALFFLIPFGLGYGGTFVLLQRLASDYFGMREYGKILGTIVMMEIAGSYVGGKVTAYLADSAGGDYTVAFYGVVFVTAGVFLCVILLNLMNRHNELSGA